MDKWNKYSTVNLFYGENRENILVTFISNNLRFVYCSLLIPWCTWQTITIWFFASFLGHLTFRFWAVNLNNCKVSNPCYSQPIIRPRSTNPFQCILDAVTDLEKCRFFQPPLSFIILKVAKNKINWGSILLMEFKHYVKHCFPLCKHSLCELNNIRE